MDYLRVRNLTTGVVHTSIEDIYKDIQMIFGHQALFNGILCQALGEHKIYAGVYYAIKPWLFKVVTDQRFWDDSFDVMHTGNYELPDPTTEDRIEMLKLFYKWYALQD